MLVDSVTVCLGALMLGDASGYEIRKIYEDGPFSAIHKAGYGSIYPALQRLLAEQAVTVTGVAQQGRPDKKVYSITDLGRRQFTEAMMAEPAPDKFRSEILFMISFADFLPVDRRRALIEQYLKTNLMHLEHLDACMAETPEAPAGRQFVCGVGRAIYAAVVTYITEHQTWLDGDTADSAPQPALPTAGDR